MRKIRIGILGCAAIAERSVIPAILALKDQYQLIAVASRTIEKANKFATKFSCEAIDGYKKLVNRDDIDALYIPLPTGLHKEWVMNALNSGKHVYAEKSIALNYKEAIGMVDKARQNNLALMEGYMFQYHSQHSKVFDIISSGTIGEIRSFSASFGFPPLSLNNFRYSNEVGGGALMDCAGYVIRAAFFVLQQNLKVHGASVFYNSDGVSIYGNAFMKGRGGIGAALSFGFDNFYQCNYQIWGSKGKITVTKAFTPGLEEKPMILLETVTEKLEIECSSDNHFIKAFEEFHKIVCTDEYKSRHYQEILEQSNALEDIKKWTYDKK